MNLTKACFCAMSALLTLGFVHHLQAQDDQDPLADALQQPGPIPEPLPIIDPILAGWEEAGSGEAGQDIGSQLRANWVMLSTSDSIEGSVIAHSSSAADMRIFVLRNGFVVNESSSDASGRFVLGGLTPGLYTLVGYRPDASFIFGFNAVGYREDVQHMPRQIVTKAVSGIPNNLLVARLIKDYAPDVKFRVYGRYAFGESDMEHAAHFGWQGLSNFDVPAEPATTIQASPIAINAAGGFRGRIHQINNLNGRPVPVIDTTLMLIQNGQILAETKADSQGLFEFRNLGTGHYGIMAVGADGLGATSIQLVAAGGDNSGIHEPGIQNVSHRAVRNGGGVDISLASPESTGWINSFFEAETFANAMNQPRGGGDDVPPVPSEFGFGGSPGGGAGGFGGEWIWAGAIAALIGQAASDGSLNPIILPPTSPSSN